MLIPKDHRFGENRPPFVTGYYEAFNKPNVSLVDLTETPDRPGHRDRHRDHRRRRPRVRRDRLGHRLRLRHRRARRAWASSGGTASRSTEHWADGPTTFLGIQTTGFPNFFFPGGPHAAAGNNPRYNGDQVDFVTDMLVYARDHGFDVIEVDPAAEERWTAMVDRYAVQPPCSGSAATTSAPTSPASRGATSSTGGRPKLFKEIADVVDHDYEAFRMTLTPTSWTPRPRLTPGRPAQCPDRSGIRAIPWRAWPSTCGSTDEEHHASEQASGSRCVDAGSAPASDPGYVERSEHRNRRRDGSDAILDVHADVHRVPRSGPSHGVLDPTTSSHSSPTAPRDRQPIAASSCAAVDRRPPSSVDRRGRDDLR